MDSTAPTVSDQIGSVLDRACGDLNTQPGVVHAALDCLAAELLAARRLQSPEEWVRTIECCRRHPLRDAVHQDPLTARAFAMSRGYQGDAALLDIIYDRDYRKHWTAPVTPLGEAIFRYTIDCQAPRAVRERRQFLAGLIDDTCRENPKAEILAAACGHLRELEFSEAIRSRSFGRLVGLDQDRETLDCVERSWGRLGVETMAASVTAFLLNPRRLPQFDLVYCAGLYDYLEPTIARLVTEKLIDMVRPGGRLVIGNYTVDTRDAGYMEAFMGWRLIYRDSDTMRRLLCDQRVAHAAIISDSTGAVIHLDARIS